MFNSHHPRTNCSAQIWTWETKVRDHLIPEAIGWLSHSCAAGLCILQSIGPFNKHPFQLYLKCWVERISVPISRDPSWRQWCTYQPPFSEQLRKEASILWNVLMSAGFLCDAGSVLKLSLKSIKEAGRWGSTGHEVRIMRTPNRKAPYLQKVKWKAF